MLKNIPQISLSIVKMEEKAVGNIQVFCRASRTDLSESDKPNGVFLGYDIACWQTKQKLTLDECLERAWFDMSFFARFCGIPMNKIKLHNMTPEEEAYIVQQMTVCF